jgi:hypothetical protein
VRRIAQRALFAVAFLPAELACSGDCVGAGCEEEFDAAFAGLFLGATEPSFASPLDGDVVIIGGANEGPDWDVAIGTARWIIGSPEDGTVRAFGTDLASGTKVPLATAPGVLEGVESDGFGASVAILDDVDGDGSKELLVGAPTYDAGTAHDGGAVYLYSGLGTNLESDASDAAPALRVSGESTSLHFGEVVRACADLDGDGLPEWAAAAPRAGRTIELSGEIALASSRDLALLDPEILMGDLGSAERSGAVFWGSSLGALAGSALDCSHDATGDGLADLWIGAPYANGASSGEGAAYLVAGGTTGPDGDGDLEGAATVTLRGESAEAWLGASIATGLFDGEVAIAVGAPGAAGSGEAATSTGEVLVWRSGDLEGGPHVRIRGAEDGDRFGATVAFGDVDGDGFDDLLVGAPHHNPDPEDSDAAFQSGAMYVFRGAKDLPATLTATDADLQIVEAAQYLRTGERVAVGDYDADGLTDFVIVNRYDPGSSPFVEP